MSTFSAKQLDQLEQMVRKVIREELKAQTTRPPLSAAEIETLTDENLEQLAAHIVEKKPEKLIQVISAALLAGLRKRRDRLVGVQQGVYNLVSWRNSA